MIFTNPPEFRNSYFRGKIFQCTGSIRIFLIFGQDIIDTLTVCTSTAVLEAKLIVEMLFTESGGTSLFKEEMLVLLINPWPQSPPRKTAL